MVRRVFFYGGGAWLATRLGLWRYLWLIGILWAGWTVLSVVELLAALLPGRRREDSR